MKQSKTVLINPAIFRNEALFMAEKHHQLPLRLALLGLSAYCNRQRYFVWQPLYLKSVILPRDSLNMESVLEALSSSGFISKHEDQGIIYGCLLPV